MSEVAVIGAGPYGLAAAALLRRAGVETRVFGEAMEFWRRQMPVGMRLRSLWDASHIASTRGALTLDEYQAQRGVKVARPIPLDDFVDYGLWFQRQVVPDLDRRQVTQTDRDGDGFRLLLGNDDVVRAKRVVVATGISPFAYSPPQFADLPPSLVSHSSEHSDLGRFAGRRVMVLGGGQSALESAALLGEGGAEVTVVYRGRQLRWLRRTGWIHSAGNPLRPVLYPPSDIGPPGLNQLVARPDLFRRLPSSLQVQIAYRSIRPAVASWLGPQLRDVRILTQRNITSARPNDRQLAIELDDGSKHHVDHLLLATGYRVDVARYPFLSQQLLRSLQCVDGYPVLATGFESSVPGLHFLGAPSAWSFGPIVRFVCGTWYTAKALSDRIASRHPAVVRADLDSLGTAA